MKLRIDIYTKGKRKLLFKKEDCFFCKRRDVDYDFIKRGSIFRTRG